MIGIDFGTSYTDAAVVDKGKVKKTFSIPSDKTSESFLRKIAFYSQGGKIALAGGLRKAEAAKFFGKLGLKTKKVGEIAAIAAGARFLSGEKKFLCANVGTGTPFVFVDGTKAEHVGGSGLGGGTIAGLGKLLLNAPAEEVSKLALRGRKNLDFTVFDALGGSIGNIPASATASNFGKAAKTKKPSRKDVAFSIECMVAESVGVMASLAASSKKCGKIVFTGRVPAKSRLFRLKAAETARLYGKNAFFPANAEYCTAIGAALSRL
ncbi:MAG TPA: hypothetical protein VI875_04635 [Candidatus Norongarragalinales archaeon]|nr:hypothetical protein [Candidatus Norongarragalinales archaeon]